MLRKSGLCGEDANEAIKRKGEMERTGDVSAAIFEEGNGTIEGDIPHQSLQEQSPRRISPRKR